MASRGNSYWGVRRGTNCGRAGGNAAPFSRRPHWQRVRVNLDTVTSTIKPTIDRDHKPQIKSACPEWGQRCFWMIHGWPDTSSLLMSHGPYALQPHWIRTQKRGREKDLIVKPYSTKFTTPLHGDGWKAERTSRQTSPSPHSKLPEIKNLHHGEETLHSVQVGVLSVMEL